MVKRFEEKEEMIEKVEREMRMSEIKIKNELINKRWKEQKIRRIKREMERELKRKGVRVK